MTYDSQELMTLFGRLFQQRAFVTVAMKSWKFDGQKQNQRGQSRLLHLLAQKDNLTNSEIVEALDIRPSSVSALVSKLEASELIERHESPDDKRVSLISLTDKGRKFIDGSKKFKDELSESMFESLTETEQQQLRSLLEKLIVDLEDKEPEWSKHLFDQMFHEFHDGKNGDHHHDGRFGNDRDGFGFSPFGGFGRR